jgi:hypothetical protein
VASELLIQESSVGSISTRWMPGFGFVGYTRISTEHGLEQEFNSLDNQREASEAE